MVEFFPNVHAHRITIDSVQRTVAEQFGLSVGQLSEKCHSRPVVIPRRIAMYLARQLTGASFPQLGRCFGGRHHTTVMHAIEKVAGQRCSNKYLAAVLAKLQHSLGGETVADGGGPHCDANACFETQHPRS
jgi:chromosomal replication initiator protein